MLFFEITLLDELLDLGNLDSCTLGTIETESMERIRCHFVTKFMQHNSSFATRKLLIRLLLTQSNKFLSAKLF